MREKASNIVSCTAVLLLAAHALPVHALPTHGGKTAHKAVAAKHAESRANVHPGRPAAAKAPHGRVSAPKLHEVARFKETHRPSKPVAGLSAHHQPAPIERRTPESASPSAPAQDDIQVTHDRKHHYTAEPTTSERELEPRKATSDDFLASFAGQPAAERKRAVIERAEAGAVAPAPIPAPKIHQLVPLEPAPAATPVLYDRRGRLIVPPALKGSHEILLHQNEMADHDGLDRIRDDEDLDRMREARLLVPLPAVAGLQLDERLPLNRRYCRPWTAQFLATLAKAYYARFHSALQVNSAVRTVEFQQRLLLTNGNAAPAEGETASPHLTGQAVDLGKHGLSMTEIAWLRGYLLPLVQAGKVDVEEEFQQACFHISVYRKYLPQPAPRREIAQTHRAAGATLATVIR